LERLSRSARAVGLDVDLGLLRRELATFCRATVQEDCGVRLIVTRGGHRIWREEALPSPRPSVGLLPVEHRVTPILIGSKTLSYAANMQAQRRARAAGMDDALLVRAEDRVVLEGPTTSFAWIERGTLVFPPLSLGVLDSITRRVAAEAVGVREREMPLEGLAEAEGALLLSTVVEAQPVGTIAGIADLDPEAPRVREIARAVREAIAARVEDP
jgi:branched-subunit amino acid aminotransferase/4-amino-4-deoxychorismate lyase